VNGTAAAARTLSLEEVDKVRPSLGCERTDIHLGDELAAEVQGSSAIVSFLGRGVRTVFVRTDQVNDLVSTRGEQLGDQTAVAPPPERLGTHHTGCWSSNYTLERMLPLGLSHPGGVASEGACPDAGEALLAGLTAPASAELDLVPIVDSGLGQGSRKRLLVELGVTAGARKTTHVEERLDAGAPKCVDELLQRTCPVSYSEYTNVPKFTTTATHARSARIAVVRAQSRMRTED
jgi:hypothetical protein